MEVIFYGIRLTELTIICYIPTPSTNLGLQQLPYSSIWHYVQKCGKIIFTDLTVFEIARSDLPVIIGLKVNLVD